MIKQVTVSFLFVIGLTSFGLAEDVSNVYTIDKRRYVSDDEWATEPYKFVVRLPNDGCSGNLVGKNKVLTAAHCIKGMEHDRVIDWLGYDGSGGKIVYDMYNSKYEQTKKTQYDYAIMQRQDSSNLVGNDNVLGNVRNGDVMTLGGVVKEIGFGCLKIMSDEEIKNFHQAYVNYLRGEIVGKKKSIERLANNNSGYFHMLMKNFIHDFYENPDKYPSLDVKMFKDCGKLKESECFVNRVNLSNDIISLPNCQGWGGNSGGGIYINTAGVPRMPDKDYLEYLHAQQEIFEVGIENLKNFVSSVDTMYAQLLSEEIQRYQVKSKEELRALVESDLLMAQANLDEINAEIQSASQPKISSDWMLVAVDTRGNYSLRSSDYAGGSAATSVKNSDVMGWDEYFNRINRYTRDKFNSLTEQENSGVPKYLYNYSKY